MKTIAYSNLRALILTLCGLLAGACDRSSELPFDSASDEQHSIAWLKSLCTDDHLPISGQIVIRGHVIGNDRFGEFFKTLVIEDATGGIALAIDHPTLANDYPFGARIEVQCNGLTLCNYGGKIMLGTAPTAEGPGRIARSDASRYIRRMTTPTVTPDPRRMTFDQITTAHADTYVLFEGVRFSTPGVWCEQDPQSGQPITSERQITDPAGRTFTLRTLGGCSYAKDPVPDGTGSLRGVIDYFGGRFSLRITNNQVLFTAVAESPTAYLSDGEY